VVKYTSWGWKVQKRHRILFENIFIEIGLRKETEEKSLFMNKEGSDITLKVQDKLIPAHKEVLIKRSKYFAALFNSGMSESREDVIEIKDCENEIFQGILSMREF